MSQKQAQTSRGVRMFMLAVGLIAALLIGGPPVEAQVNRPVLFSSAGAVQPDILKADAAHVARSRYVHVNRNALFDANGRPRDAASLPEITLNLFNDATFTGVVKSAKTDGWGTTWQGRLKNHADGYFYLTAVEDGFIAHVASPQGVYEVSSAGKGVYKAVKIDQSKFADHPPHVEYDPPGELLPMDSPGDLADSASRIDIMVVYTAAARAAEGGTAAMKARIKLAVDQTNTSYSRSGVTTRLRLVHVEQVTYAENGSLSIALNDLKGTSDGKMDIVHSRRNTYGADMVCLIVENGGAYCGLAAAVMASASNAFQVTARNCMTGNYSFGHEFGHLQGARHDVYVDPTTTPYTYGHGYVHPKTTVTTKRWRTIMAYNNQCTAWGYNCQRLLYWSNPVRYYTDDPMGNTKSQNYRVLNNTDYTVANFRTQKISSDFSSSFNTSSSGWSAVNGTWQLYSSAYYGSTGRANLFASAVRSGRYGDLTYEVRMRRTGTNPSLANHISIRGEPSPLDIEKRWNREYKFTYNNSGSFSVWEINGSTRTALKSWTASSAIVQNGWNTLKVIAVGSSLKFYINNVLVWSGADTTLKTGKVGFGFFRDADSGKLLVNWAKVSTTPTADLNPFDEAAPGVEIPGGDDTRSP